MGKIRSKPLLIATGTYLGSLLIAFLISSLLGVTLSHNLENVKDNHETPSIFWVILLNNLKVYVIILTGFFLLKIPTYLNLLSNGAMLGYFLGGVSLDLLVEVLPPLIIHGVPEVMGFIIAAYLVILGREKFRENIKFNISLLVLGGLIIFIAALLETYVSSIFLN
ncbi:stage II sporulation protein M [Pontibacillus salipaludis]|uniref:Stage II sporulation protein M n=1 Tax=Pontibacillus salipaludis TaxID=1697394 RepID=A0ABQ1QKA3_9BACI|nr:stage II sporulation protein M [Pontibacillus salipaludis]GGD29021.1 hypothetical protein GCM10011389_40770 [Pontibacillus salipaludis]